ncbi:MAG: iron-containing alcohol dehydrogenase [Planctomycetaceae bacterium]|nr:iron-containing alcohol dehydrogenase [Planctomycetaceae bacterium]
MQGFGSFLPGRVEFGSGTISVLPDWVKGKSILFMSDAGVKGSGILDPIVAACKGSAAGVTEFYETPTEPSEDDAAAVAARFKEATIDAIVAVGGGSVLDTAKVLGVLIGSDASVADLFDGKFPASRSITLIMVPTAAGTGAEATPNSILYRPSMKLKVGIVCGLFVADKIILDPDLTLGLPQGVTAATGLDALCHAIECLVSNKANPLSDMLSTEALRLIFANLRKAYKNGRDVDARANMLLASFYAGISIACAGTNIVHALSYPLGGRYRIPHGVSNAILLAPAMGFNAGVSADKLAGLAGFIGDASSLNGRDSRVEAVMRELEALTRDLGLPRKLADLGVPASDLEVLVEDAYKVRRLLDNNPREVGKDDIRAIYQSLC